MQRLKSQELLSHQINEVIVAGVLTAKSEISRSKIGNKMIKFVLDKSIYCIALNDYAMMINTLDKQSILLVVGKIILYEKKNIILATDVELYTIQEPIDVKKVKKSIKREKTKF